MSSKIAHYLQEHVVGEVTESKTARNYFATDGSVFRVEPRVIVYPRNATDVRKVVRFLWQLAERGHVIPVTARGRGSDQAGAALGGGVMLVFPAHMNRVLGFDGKRREMTVEPGTNYREFQNIAISHGFFLPPYPSSIDYSTIGGAIANNAAGEKTIKYGPTGNFVGSLDVVLANGELIKTGRLSKRELSHKKGQTNFEGKVYRELDGLISDNKELIEKTRLDVSKNTAGYNLRDVKRRDGSFDLTPLIVGSQGTLGIVTRAILKVEPFNHNPLLIAAYFSDIHQANEAVRLLMKLEPSALEMVDKNLLEFIKTHNPNQLRGLVDEPLPSIVLLIEFDDTSERQRKKKFKRAKKVLDGTATEISVARDAHERDMLWKVRHSAAAVIWHTEGSAKALPIIEDGVVPSSVFPEFIKNIYEIFERNGLKIAVWGHAGNANLHLQPFLDLGTVGDRQKLFKVMDEYYNMVIGLGGSTAGEHNDGRLRAPYLKQLYGPDVYDLFVKVKKIFDPTGLLNPDVKIGVTKDDLVKLLRKEYSMEHLSDHMPRI